MKNSILRLSLTALAVFQSFSLVLAQDYSGHHADREGGSIIDMIPMPIIIILIIICVIALWGLRDKKN